MVNWVAFLLYIWKILGLHLALQTYYIEFYFFNSPSTKFWGVTATSCPLIYSFLHLNHTVLLSLVPDLSAQCIVQKT